MEKLEEKYELTAKALQKLKTDLDLITSNDLAVEKYYEQFRSSAIQSFEFSIDTLWKCVKLYLIEKFSSSFNAPNPQLVFRECWNVNLINKHEFNQISKLIADRNLTSHSYNEETAEEIKKRLPEHYQLMKTIFDRLDVL